MRHPCLVLSVERDEAGRAYLIVAGGTSCVSKNGDPRPIRPYDLVCATEDPAFQAKSLQSTKFSLAANDILLLPYTREFFYILPDQAWPKIGAVDFDNPEMNARLSKAGGQIKDAIQREKDKLAQPPDN